jgi:hypothetical protein
LNVVGDEHPQLSLGGYPGLRHLHLYLLDQLPFTKKNTFVWKAGFQPVVSALSDGNPDLH